MPSLPSGISRPELVKPLDAELERRGPEYWASRAEDARTLAAQMSDPLSRKTMENIAASYDKLAEWARKTR